MLVLSQQGLRACIPMAGRLKCFIHLLSHREARQLEAGSVGFLTGKVNVLHQMPYQKAGGEVTSQSPEDSPVNGTFATVVRSVSCMWAQAGC